MAKDIFPGKYNGKIVNYGLRAAKNNGLMAMIEFEYVDQENDPHRLLWRGAFAGGALEWTLKTLFVCGFKGRDVSVLADGIPSGQLDMTKDFVVTVEPEVYEGKTYYRISWVNEPGLHDLLTRADAIVRLKGLNVDAAIMELRQATGYKPKVQAAAPVQSNPNIPF